MSFWKCALDRLVGSLNTDHRAATEIDQLPETLAVAVPDTCPGRTPARTFPLVRRVHGNGLRSRERRFESCREHWSKA
jgi:hypothetical protein